MVFLPAIFAFFKLSFRNARDLYLLFIIATFPTLSILLSSLLGCGYKPGKCMKI
jgi:hypothetical protein